MQIGMQSIEQSFESGIHEFKRQDLADHQNENGPPDRRRSKKKQDTEYAHGRDRLKTEALLPLERGPYSCERESHSLIESKILRHFIKTFSIKIKTIPMIEPPAMTPAQSVS